ncbi:nuclear transport factor 2 family protein [Thermomonas sp.]|uniref:nuclear transport factor 2 family protein n=1 Tax=Thermomonas sp. TaxID=1971895 RepID=UPI0035B35927
MDARCKAGRGLLLGGLLVCAPALARTPNDAVAEAQLREVIRRFDAALVARDGATLRGLFLPQPGAWASVLGDAGYARLKVRRPDAQRVRPDSYGHFADMVEAAERPQRERFSDIDIRTDGAMASVSFDYVYEEDGVAQNRGIESWQLVKLDDGWKIMSMLYSVHQP